MQRFTYINKNEEREQTEKLQTPSFTYFISLLDRDQTVLSKSFLILAR